MRWAYALTLLLSAALLFTVQPMVAKMVLPILGGSPAVWNTCMVFFQVGLLGGYLYAHLLSRRLPTTAQFATHAVVVLLPLLVLPVSVGGQAAPPADHSPVGWLLATLAAACGLPFLVVASTGPLLQRWFSRSGGVRASDPYFLYAASNLGSLGGLLAYPLLLEPGLPLTSPPDGYGLSQASAWTASYVLFALLAVGCGALAVRAARLGAVPEEPPPSGPPPSVATWGRWIALALVPSSLLLGVTQFLTTDIAAIPLLWVIPLALYLLTFVAAFGWGDRLPLRGISWAFAALAVSAAMLELPEIEMVWTLPLIVHLLLFVAAALMCHVRLARSRPDPTRLTGYYLALAVGGALGGVFNALVAPLLFNDVLEYPLVLLVACLLRPCAPESGDLARHRAVLALDVLLPAVLLGAVYGIHRILPEMGADPSLASRILIGVVPAALALAMARRRARFTLALTVLLAFPWITVREAGLVHRARGFFGVHRVASYLGDEFPLDDEGGLTFRVPYHVLVHGSTRHGSQALQGGLRRTPTTYYHRSGPIGQVFEAFRDSPLFDDIALVGLGAGTLTAYGAPHRRITVYEIDPEVVRIARDPTLFTYLEDTPSPVEIVLGDGRRSLERAPDGAYGLIVLDAFTSDAVPVHLLTREAMALYVKKLRPGGLLAIHLTNGYLDLPPVVGAVADDLRLTALVQRDNGRTPREKLELKDFSVWAVVARTRDDLGPLGKDPRWQPLAGEGAPRPRPPALWTDRYSNLITIFDPR